jgi:hypothetical protein
MAYRLHRTFRAYDPDDGNPRPTLGQSMVEFALILPIFALFLVIAIDFGRVFFTYVQLTNSAREAANYGASNPTDEVGMETRATREQSTQGQGGESAWTLSFECSDPTGTSIDCEDAKEGSGPGNHLSVTLAEQFDFLTPLVSSFFDDFTMRASATATVTGFAGGAGGGSNPTCTTVPSPTFTVVVTTGLTVHVDPLGSTPDSGVCNISGFNWDWGDGTEPEVGLATGLDHTYAAAGTYTIQLTATNQAGERSAVHAITVPAGPPAPTCAKPVANFTWTSSGKSRTYSDASSVADPVNCPITNWLWTFTDLGTTSNAQNPATQTYGNNSGHPVTLTVTNAGGSTSITKNT